MQGWKQKTRFHSLKLFEKVKKTCSFGNADSLGKKRNGTWHNNAERCVSNMKKVGKESFFDSATMVETSPCSAGLVAPVVNLVPNHGGGVCTYVQKEFVPKESISTT
jgi:hypothetical protein